MEVIAFGQQDGLLHARLEIEMPAEDAAAEGAGDHDPISGTGSAPPQRARRSNGPQERDADRQRGVPTVRVAAGDGKLVTLGQGQHPFVQCPGEIHPSRTGQSQRHHASQGPAGHRGQIAEVDRQRFASHPLRIGSREVEIDAVHEHVNRNDALIGARHLQHGRIVANPHAQEWVAGEPLAEIGYQLLFHENSSLSPYIPHAGRNDTSQSLVFPPLVR